MIDQLMDLNAIEGHDMWVKAPETQRKNNKSTNKSVFWKKLQESEGR